MVDQLIQNQRIRTTLAKAKEIKPLADKMVTLGKRVCLSFFLSFDIRRSPRSRGETAISMYEDVY